jgi:hypothetical protein
VRFVLTTETFALTIVSFAAAWSHAMSFALYDGRKGRLLRPSPWFPVDPMVLALDQGTKLLLLAFKSV